MPGRRWTKEQREGLSEQVRRWKPWEKSTGPRTALGKAKVAKNPFKGGVRAQLRALAKALKRQDEALGLVE